MMTPDEINVMRALSDGRWRTAVRRHGGVRTGIAIRCSACLRGMRKSTFRCQRSEMRTAVQKFATEVAG